MSSGFWQIKLDKSSSDLCTFNTPFGRYKFLRMPFGIKSAPEVFQRKVLQIFGGIQGVQAVFDDLIIAGETEHEHDEILHKVLETAEKNKVTFNKEKLQLRVNSVKYMGNIVSADGFQPDPDKVRAINEMEDPKNKEELKRFLGVVNYLSRFIPKYSEITAPLRQLLKNDVEWTWQEGHKTTFKLLKAKLCNAPVLRYYDEKKSIVLQTDASKDGLGACITQNSQPIAYSSRSLTEAEKNFAQIEKELLAIVYGMEKYHQYVYGNKVTVQTDHKPLISIVKKEISQVTSRLQRMMLKLIKYDLNVIYVPGKDMYSLFFFL